MSHQLGKGFSMGTLSPSLSTRLISYSQWVCRIAIRCASSWSFTLLYVVWHTVRCVETGNISPYYGSLDVQLRKS
jgi:hypothetical protein